MSGVRHAVAFGRRVAVRPWRSVALVLGGASLFSGVALLTTVVADVSLPLALAIGAVLVAVAGGAVVWRAGAHRRFAALRVLAAGVLAGLVATAAYDASRTVLSRLDASPYDPFEALRVFGTLLVGPGASAVEVHVAGAAFHLLNGTAFGLGYAFLFARLGRTGRRRAAVSGVAWGLFLETFQLTLYPGWLDIRAYDEFVRVSVLSHVVYGATLGLAARAFLRRAFRRAPLRASGR